MTGVREHFCGTGFETSGRDVMRQSEFCAGPGGRREFLRAGVLAAGGLTLPQLLAAQRAAAVSAGGIPDTSVILFWMWG
ncbi:MAG TPA: hypothetical protein DCX79_04245, partial [Planctomycetaceae bacterium]|nr:hypothetical protein [Planctomycetaceae bacterium]